jgi:hypothetical protein
MFAGVMEHVLPAIRLGQNQLNLFVTPRLRWQALHEHEDVLEGEKKEIRLVTVNALFINVV